MRELRLNREINPNGQILRDDKGNLTGISLSSDLVKIRNLSIDTLTSSTGTIPTEGSLYFEGSEGLRFNLVDSFSEKSGALTSSGDVAVGMNRWANALTQFWIYEPIASPADYFNITVLASGATSLNTIDGAGSDASLSLIPDGDLNFTPSTGDVLISSTVSEKPQLTLKNTNDDATAGKIVFNKNGTSPNTNDVLGSIEFTGEDAGGNAQDYATITSSVPSQIDGQEGGKIELQVASHDGEMVTGLKIQDGSEEDEIDVFVASGTSSRTLIAGDLTMYGQTLTMQNATASHPQMLITNTNADANGGNIHFYKNSTSTADNDSLGTMTWEGNNDQSFPGETATVCRIDGQFLDVSENTEKGRINLDVAEYDGTLTTGATIFGTATNGQVDVTLGAATTSTVALAGKLQVAEVSSPSAPSDGAGGYLYTKTDGKPYWISNEVSETDLSASGGGGSTTLVWHTTVGGYKVNNNSSTIYYTFYRHWYENWSNGDSSPTTISASDSYASFMIAPAAGTLTGIKIVGTASDSGFDDPFKFYMFKGTVGNDATSASLTAIGTTSSITPSTSSRTWTHSESFSSSNSFSAGDSLYIWLKKDSTSGNQDLYWNLTLFGEYS